MALNPEVVELGNIVIYFGTAAPTGGSATVAAWPQFQIGDIVMNTSTPSTGQPICWRCATASTAAVPAGVWVTGPVYT